MNKLSDWRLVALSLALGLAPAGLAQGPYVLTRIHCPGASATDWTNALGINSEGQVVGFCKVGTTYPSFVFSEGSFTWVNVPGKDMTHAWGINPRGDVVGTSHNFGQPQRGFLLSQGNVTWIDFPGALETFPKGVNPQGDKVVGYYRDSVGAMHGFLWSEGSFATIDPPERGTRTAAMGINSRGDIAGWYRDAADKNHGYLRREGVFTTIDIPGATYTNVGGGPNPQGDVAGSYFDSSGKRHHFVLRAMGDLITFDGVPDASWSMIHGLNAAGEVVGHYGDPVSGRTRGWGLLLPRW